MSENQKTLLQYVTEVNQAAFRHSGQDLIDEAEKSRRVEINSKTIQSLDVSRHEEFVKMKIDPLVLFQQIELLRKDGVDEETIRTAFAEFMDCATGQPGRRAQPVMKRHVGSVPMPSQAEINEMYEERYKGLDFENADPSVKLIVERLEESERARKELSKIPKLTHRAKLKVYIVKKLLQFMIFACKALGVR